ncbi:MAG: hypothetical protein WCC64_06395 [Aliidongia sp.]
MDEIFTEACAGIGRVSLGQSLLLEMHVREQVDRRGFEPGWGGTVLVLATRARSYSLILSCFTPAAVSVADRRAQAASVAGFGVYENCYRCYRSAVTFTSLPVRLGRLKEQQVRRGRYLIFLL